jgi:hypothetical protein
MQTTKPRESTTFERSYPGLVDQVARVRADLAQAALGCPVADDLVLLVSDSLNLTFCSSCRFWWR